MDDQKNAATMPLSYGEVEKAYLTFLMEKEKIEILKEKLRNAQPPHVQKQIKRYQQAAYSHISALFLPTLLLSCTLGVLIVFTLMVLGILPDHPSILSLSLIAPCAVGLLLLALHVRNCTILKTYRESKKSRYADFQSFDKEYYALILKGIDLLPKIKKARRLLKEYILLP